MRLFNGISCSGNNYNPAITRTHKPTIPGIKKSHILTLLRDRPEIPPGLSVFQTKKQPPPMLNEIDARWNVYGL